MKTIGTGRPVLFLCGDDRRITRQSRVNHATITRQRYRFSAERGVDIVGLPGRRNRRKLKAHSEHPECATRDAGCDRDIPPEMCYPGRGRLARGRVVRHGGADDDVLRLVAHPRASRPRPRWQSCPVGRGEREGMGGNGREWEGMRGWGERWGRVEIVK